LLRKNQAFQGSAIRFKPARHNFYSKKLKVGCGPQIFFPKIKITRTAGRVRLAAPLQSFARRAKKNYCSFQKKQLSVMKTLLSKNQNPRPVLTGGFVFLLKFYLLKFAMITGTEKSFS
jgi:hypothetical protein